MTRFITALSALALLAACGGSDAPTTKNAIPAVTDEPAAPASALLMPLPSNTSTAISGDDIAQRIAALADDTFEGRAPGTETGEASARWIAAEMKRIGLKPAAKMAAIYSPSEWSS